MLLVLIVAKADAVEMLSDCEDGLWMEAGIIEYVPMQVAFAGWRCGWQDSSPPLWKDQRAGCTLTPFWLSAPT